MDNKRLRLFREIKGLFTQIPMDSLSARDAGNLSELGCCLVELEKELEPVEEFLFRYDQWKRYDASKLEVWSAYTSNAMEAKVNKLFKEVEI